MGAENTRLAIFAVTYAMLSLKQVPVLRLTRPAAALVGAVAMVTLGAVRLQDAYAAIDADVLVFLFGVMLLTAHLEIGGFFAHSAEWLMRTFHSRHALLAAVVVSSGLLSAFFMNDTICLVLTPVVLATIRRTTFRPLPFLLAIALAANVGSALAITGNPQNMLVGLYSGIGYGGFMRGLALPAIGGLVIVYGVVALVYRRDLATPATAAAPASPESPESSESPLHSDVLAPGPMDRVLVTKSLLIFVGALAGWLLGASLPLVALAAGALLLAIARRDPTEALSRVQWPLLVLFASLFVVTAAIRDSAPVVALTSLTLRNVSGSLWREAGTVSGAMLVLSNLVSNVPAVLLWIPVVPRLPDAHFLWLVIAMSSTFAGNLTLLGSIANLLVAEGARAGGATLGFVDYLRAGVPITLLTIAWGIAMLVLFH